MMNAFKEFGNSANWENADKIEKLENSYLNLTSQTHAAECQ